MGLFVLLAPVLILVYGVIGRLFPNVLLGRWYTVIIDVALAIGIALITFWLLRRPSFGSWLRKGWRRRALISAAVGGWIITPSAFLVAHYTLGSPSRYPSECEHWSSLLPDTCEGRSFSLMQGTYSYQRVRGRVNGKMCERLQIADVPTGPTYAEMSDRSDSHPSCEPGLIEGWRARSCGPYGLPAEWSCYVCSSVTTGFDIHNKLQAFDPSCSEGVGYATATEALEAVPSKLDKFSAVGDRWRGAVLPNAPGS